MRWWGELGAVEQKSPGVLFGIGLCAEIAGDLKKALEFYNRSNRLLDKPDRTIGDALARAKEAQFQRSKLERQTTKEEAVPQKKKSKN